MDKTKIFEAAGKYAAKGQLDKASKEYQRILEEDPKDVRALQKLAEIHQKNGKSKDATDLMLRVAEGYTEQGFFLKAVAVYKQILKVGVERVDVNAKLAQLYQQLGLIGDATQQYQLVANYYDRTGSVKESLAALRKMVDLDPDNVASQVKLGELYAREQLIPEAVTELRKATQYLKKNGRADDHFRVLERIGQLAPDDAPTAKELAQSYLALSDTKRALAKLQVCFRQNPKDVETLLLLARAFTDLGQEAKTVSVYRELARVHQEQGNTNDYRHTLERILEVSPGDPEAVTALRELAAKSAPASVIAPPSPEEFKSNRRAPTPAAGPPQGGRQQRPLSPDIHPAIAKMLTETDVYLKYGLLPKAVEHIKRALIEDPDSIDAHEKALLIQEKQGKTEEMVQTLARLVELSRERGDSDRSSEYTQELAQRAPGHPLVEAEAAAADLPEMEEVFIESDDGDEEGVIIGQPDDVFDDGIHIDTEPTIPPLSARRAPPPPSAPWDRVVGVDEEEAVHVDAGEPTNDPRRRALDLGDDAAFEAALDRATSPHVLKPPIDPFESYPPNDDDVLVPEEDLGSASQPPYLSPVEVSAAHAFFAHGGDASMLDEMPSLDATPLDEPASQLEQAALEAFEQQDQTEFAAPSEATAEDDFAEEYQEAEFLLQQGLTEDACHVLEAIKLAAPDHPRATALLSSLRPSLGEEAAVAPPPAYSGTFDLASELADEFDKVDTPRPAPPPRDATHSVKDVLSEFKQNLSSQVSVEDSQTHYDLGIAYKEMGLYDEALHEFEVALQGRGRRRVIDCLIMLGVCRLEKGDPRAALRQFEQVLKTPGLTLEASKEAHFEIGHCQELLGEERSALDHYARVHKADAAFRDVKARLARLSSKLRGSPTASISMPPVNGTGNHGSATNGASVPPRDGSPALAPAMNGAAPSRPPSGEQPENTGPRGGRGKIGYI
jgi:pilus assembly protein FimV